MALRPQSLPSLGVFAVAARHQNFAHAAEELHLTASAVSHHVRQLERTLGVVLFQRHARGVVLTPGGRALADAATGALSDLEAVAHSLRRPERGVTTLTVATLHSLTYCWLLPRLSRFTAAHPKVRFKFETSVALARFDDAGPDLAIRYGVGHWPGLTAHHLMSEELLPVAAPTLAGLERVRVPEDILRLPLVHDLGLQGWPEWFRAAGVHGVRIPEMHIFTESTDSVLAAARGLGATLTRSRIGAPYLRSGEVVRLPGPSLKARFAYYAVHPAHRRPGSMLAAFIEWLQHEARADSPPA
ncbi:MAG: LysR family transcriptional regulator [Proteobacteria bacterium]|nr:LysR family transcriptional regulator [Pseudomonadota bacterium]